MLLPDRRRDKPGEWEHGGVGASGIRRRKRRQGPEQHPVLPPGDAQRVFGQFTNDAYTPAGTLERNGFFWRQLTRRRGHDWRSLLGYGIWAGSAFVISLLVVGPIVLGLWRVLG
jgi:hypothetical protein